MKVISENNAYVQKHDISYLTQTNITMPSSIMMQVFGKGPVIINDSNRYEFVEFTKTEEIDFFKEQDWIIDYNDVKDLSNEEAIELGQNIARKKNELAKKYNSMSKKEKDKNEDLYNKCELLEFKMYSLRDIIWYNQGKLKMNVPGEEKGIKKLIKTIFNKK